MRKKTTIYLDDKSHQAIEKIKEYYGLSENSAVIRLALASLAKEVEKKDKKRG